jgi:hypothetical protein
MFLDTLNVIVEEPLVLLALMADVVGNELMWIYLSGFEAAKDHQALRLLQSNHSETFTFIDNASKMNLLAGSLANKPHWSGRQPISPSQYIAEL